MKLGFGGLMMMVVVLIGVGGLISIEAAALDCCIPSNPEMMNSIHSRIADLTLFDFQSRKLKWSMEDYGSVDPVPAPSSTTSIRPGPIQHGAPQIPYIPGPPGLVPPPSSQIQAIVNGGLA